MGAKPSPWAVVACFLGLGAVILGAALAGVVERAQPTIIDVPDQARLVAYDTPMYNVVVYGPESEIDDATNPEIEKVAR